MMYWYLETASTYMDGACPFKIPLQDDVDLAEVFSNGSGAALDIVNELFLRMQPILTGIVPSGTAESAYQTMSD